MSNNKIWYSKINKIPIIRDFTKFLEYTKLEFWENVYKSGICK